MSAIKTTQLPANSVGPIARALLDVRRKEDLSDQCLVTDFFLDLLGDPRIGGMRGMVRFAADTHKLAEQTQSVPVRAAWLKQLLAIAQDCERAKLERESQFSDEEIYERMVASVVDEVHRNPTFAAAMVVTAVKSMQDRADYGQRLDRMILMLEMMKLGDFSLADRAIDDASKGVPVGDDSITVSSAYNVESTYAPTS